MLCICYAVLLTSEVRNSYVIDVCMHTIKTTQGHTMTCVRITLHCKEDGASLAGSLIVGMVQQSRQSRVLHPVDRLY
jgi:hypothetical protein